MSERGVHDYGGARRKGTVERLNESVVCDV